ncbi:MAG: valine--tRNA ligase [Tannerella sp.]|jgi:valyl-tRNA synthetase|nr:valine--tRNA ligase [Tannerella sp.]
MELATKYDPSTVEEKWYGYWLEQGLFKSKPDGREPYTIVIPPPNVTGVLHMGHMLNNTIQDILVRRARMQGKNACWVPGTDHASIATEAKVVAKLAAEGVKKTDLTREQFLEHAWEWTHKHGGIILEQLKKLGASCDWDRTCFTMDEERSQSVLKVFVDLYNKGKIYRGVRMVNWDPKALTALSDEEVIYKEQQGKLYYLRYEICPGSPLNSPGSPLNSPGGGASKATPAYKTARNSAYGLLKGYAKELRRVSTEAESTLWEMLRGGKMEGKFRRQHVIDEFVVDFVCLSQKLVIEVDGGYHTDPEIQEADKLRTGILNELGYQVLRFTNEEVLANTDIVLQTIQKALQSSPPGGVEGAAALYAVVATTRPETIMGDTAMCINPNDPKTAWLKGKKVIVPLVNRVIPVIEDEYVDMEFGTGCLKVTPAHDVNDYMLGEKYNLPSIDIFNDDGTISEAGEIYVGMDRFDVRKQIVKDLEAAGLLDKIEDYTNKVGFSERTDSPIEPKLSMQWFMKMEEIAKPALEAVLDDTIKFYPVKFKNTYRHWMENIKDWCISRQLWWGHRIPAWYLEGKVFVAETREEAYRQALSTVDGQFSIDDLRRDEDCLDTWFSSWLWPISVFDGINNPDNEDIKYYYPTNDLVTGPDIIFFWVARMIMSGYQYRRLPCFTNVYFTGIVRDKLGRKMSKQLGNSPDPIELINKFGADGVRMGMLLSAAAGNDLLFNETLCEQGRFFCNKIWNAFRFIKGLQVVETESLQNANSKAIAWFNGVLQKAGAEQDDLFSKYRISEALMGVYKLFWDEFSAWYLEIIKPPYEQPVDKATYDRTLDYFEELLKLLHPFMPFITEELWHALKERKDGESIMTQRLTKNSDTVVDETVIADFENIKEVIAAIRTIRVSKNVPPREPLSLLVNGNHNSDFDEIIMKLCNIKEISSAVESESDSGSVSSFMVGATKYAVPLGNLINVEEEIEKLEKELKYQEGFMRSVAGKLSNERFVANAKPEIVANERKKLSDAESKIASLKASIEGLNSVSN